MANNNRRIVCIIRNNNDQQSREPYLLQTMAVTSHSAKTEKMEKMMSVPWGGCIFVKTCQSARGRNQTQCERRYARTDYRMIDTRD